MAKANLTRFAWLSIAAAIATITLKSIAYLMTGSVGLLSDAVESLVNLAAAVFALWMLHVAAKPADEEHAYGHTKAEYFASGIEGGLIVLAAGTIIWTAIDRLRHPRAVEQLGAGLAVSIVASLVNLAVAIILLRAGRRYRSITLEADGKHLMTDVWTSAGVVVAVGAIALTGWHIIDPIVALAVAANIIRAGVQLVQRSAHGLLDVSIDEADRMKVEAILGRYREQGIEYHALRTRQSGSRPFVEFHLLVPPEWTVKRGHDLLEDIEREIAREVEGAHVFTHLEPLGDPASYEDILLSRGT